MLLNSQNYVHMVIDETALLGIAQHVIYILSIRHKCNIEIKHSSYLLQVSLYYTET